VNATGDEDLRREFSRWTLDAFDFFLVIVVVPHIAADFKMGVAAFATAITLTLPMRPVGALIFGWFADRYGRRVPLMWTSASTPRSNSRPHSRRTSRCS